MKKLILEEDELLDEEPLIKDLSSASLITTLIKNTWDSVDLFNSVALTLTNDGNDEAVEVVNDIVNSLYINIGQLESILQKENEQAEAIDDGKEGVESDLGNVLVPEDDVEVEVEG